MALSNRLILYLCPEERAALLQLAASNVRRPDDELRRLLRDEANRVGITISQSSFTNSNRAGVREDTSSAVATSQHLPVTP